PLLAAIRTGGVHGLAHITGGGLTENLPRALPDGLGVEIDLDAWTLPPVFTWLANTGGVSEAEMLKTFNCGIGMVAIVAAEHAPNLKETLSTAGETVIDLGRVTQGDGVHYNGSLL
ncbi:MAG: AIR synthase-related protein, partial [Pseudomonadota bacterium]